MYLQYIAYPKSDIWCRIYGQCAFYLSLAFSFSFLIEINSVSLSSNIISLYTLGHKSDTGVEFRYDMCRNYVVNALMKIIMQILIKCGCSNR